MSLGHTKAFAALSARLRWDLENIKVSTDNLARAELTGSQQKRLTPFSFQAALSGIKRTHEGHLTGKQDGIRQITAPQDRMQEESLTGNNISAQHEMMQVNDSSTRAHQMMTLHKKLTQMYKTVLTVSK